MKIERTELPDEIREFVKPMFGTRCCRRRVNGPRGLHLGFGEKLYHGDPKLIDTYYGEWEIGTYYCGWRVIKDGKILCGSDDVVEAYAELDAAIQRIEMGAILSLEQLGHLDIRVGLDTGIVIDFLS